MNKPLNPHLTYIKCPLCNTRFKLSNVNRHISRAHKDFSISDFYKILNDTAAKRTLTIQNYENRGPTINTATSVLSNARKSGARGVGKIVSGGAFGLGKRK